MTCVPGIVAPREVHHKSKLVCLFYQSSCSSLGRGTGFITNSSRLSFASIARRSSSISNSRALCFFTCASPRSTLDATNCAHAHGNQTNNRPQHKAHNVATHIGQPPVANHHEREERDASTDSDALRPPFRVGPGREPSVRPPNHARFLAT